LQGFKIDRALKIGFEAMPSYGDDPDAVVTFHDSRLPIIGLRNADLRFQDSPADSRLARQAYWQELRSALSIFQTEMKATKSLQGGHISAIDYLTDMLDTCYTQDQNMSDIAKTCPADAPENKQIADLTEWAFQQAVRYEYLKVPLLAHIDGEAVSQDTRIALTQSFNNIDHTANFYIEIFAALKYQTDTGMMGFFNQAGLKRLSPEQGNPKPQRFGPVQDYELVATPLLNKVRDYLEDPATQTTLVYDPTAAQTACQRILHDLAQRSPR
jgi:hypothetical protein